jgi:hypothetical protein
MDANPAADHRYAGTDSAVVEWPNVLKADSVVVKGGLKRDSGLQKAIDLLRRWAK